MKRIVLAISLLGVMYSGNAQELTGKQIIERVLAAFPQKDFLCQARLTSTSESGLEQTLDVQIQTRKTAEAIASAIVVTGPTNLEGNAVLTLFRKDGTEAIYRKRPGEKKGERIHGASLGESFAGTDFACEDFDFGFLRWPEHKLVGEKRRQARDCFVIESVPGKGQSAQYGKVVSWIDKESSLLMLAEGHAPDGKLLKVFDIRSLKQFEGGWFIKTMNLKHLAANRQTRLEVTQFEHALNLDDRYFSPETFGRVAAFKFPQGTKSF
jgi:hypothetical protein